MSYATRLSALFGGVELEPADLMLLQPFQLAMLPERAPEAPLAAVLHADACVRRAILKRLPGLQPFVSDLLARHPPGDDPTALTDAWQALGWEIADLIIYTKAPEVFDARADFGWRFSDVTNTAPVAGRVVIDAGAGTGRLTFAAARAGAAFVFAVEPVARLRAFIRERAHHAGLRNVFVVDGYLDLIPYPAGFADVLLTSHAVGWRLTDELAEIDRVVKPGGHVVHLTGYLEEGTQTPLHRTLVSERWGYSWAPYDERDGPKRKYYKQRRPAPR